MLWVNYNLEFRIALRSREFKYYTFDPTTQEHFITSYSLLIFQIRLYSASLFSFFLIIDILFCTENDIL